MTSSSDLVMVPLRNSSSNKGPARRQRKAHGKRGLRIEALEDRSMLATIVVTSLADNSTVDGLVTLREALAAANTNTSVDGSVAGNGNDTITFAPSLTASGPATIKLGITGDNTFGPSGLFVTSNVTIQGPTGANGITIARDTTAAPVRLRLFDVGQAGSLTLNNLTLTGGVALGGNGAIGGGGGAGLGGAIMNQGALFINASTFTGNQAQGGNGSVGLTGGGGGMGADAAADAGGGPNSGGGFGGGGSFTAINDGGFGGGGAAFGFGGFGSGGGTFFSGGFGGGSGGSTSSGGGAGLGGAIFNYGGSIEITNSTFSDDKAVGGTRGDVTGINGKGFGSEIFNLNGSVFLLNATLQNTDANSGSGSIFNLGDNSVATQSGPALPSTTAHVDMYNSILRNLGGLDYTSTSQFGGAELTTGANTLFATTYSPGTNFKLVNPISAAPNLGSLANNGGPTQTLLPAIGSPVINAGISKANEVQKLTVSGATGQFTLTFNGQTTSALAFNASNVLVQNALNALATIGGVGGSVTVTQSAGVYTITFGGTLASSNQALITATASGGATAAVAAYTQGFTLPAFDQRGTTARVLGTAVDLGAVEQVSAPAVTVTVVLVGNQLVITGDNKADRLKLVGTANPNEFTVIGLNGTSVNGIVNNTVTTAGVNSIVWNLTNGADVITMDNVNVAGNVTIGGGTGVKSITLGTAGAVKVGGNLAIDGGLGNGTILVTKTTSVGTMNIVGGKSAGINFLTTTYSSAGSNYTVTGGPGIDLVTQTQVAVGGLWNINAGAGSDVVNVYNSSATGAATFITGLGFDSIIVGGSIFRGGIALDGSAGGGIKTLNMFTTTFTGAATLTGGEQTDFITFTTNTGGRATINSGSGADVVLVQFSVLDSLYASLGDGNDLITLLGSRIKGTTSLDGGAGFNYFGSLGNVFQGPVTRNRI